MQAQGLAGEIGGGLMLSVSATMASMWRCFARDQARLPWAWQVNMTRPWCRPAAAGGWAGEGDGLAAQAFELGERLGFSDMGGFHHGVGACRAHPGRPVKGRTGMGRCSGGGLRRSAVAVVRLLPLMATLTTAMPWSSVSSVEGDLSGDQADGAGGARAG